MKRISFATLPILFLAFASSGRGAGVPITALVDEIATNNPELAFYEAELAAARATGRATVTPPHDPELAFAFGRKRVRDSTGATMGEGTTWSVSVAYTFDWPGRTALRKAIANHDVALAELGLARFRAALLARARTLAYGLGAAQQQAEATAEVAERFHALKEVFHAREPGGLTPLLETRVIEAQEIALQRRATATALALQAALIELNQLRGVAADTPLQVVLAPLAFQPAPDVPALLALARERNFEFQTRRVELEQQGFIVELARHERRPSLTLSPFVEREEAGDRETTAGIGFSVALPSRTRGRAGIDAAEARRLQAETALHVAQRELERAVLTTAATYSTHVAETEHWKPDAIVDFREAAALADRHYRLGAVPLSTYVELQTAYLDAVEALLATQREALAAGLELQLLTGLDTTLVELVTP